MASLHLSQGSNSISFTNMAPNGKRTSTGPADIDLSQLSLKASTSEAQMQHIPQSESMGSAAMSIESMEDREAAVQLQPVQSRGSHKGKARQGNEGDEEDDAMWDGNGNGGAYGSENGHANGYGLKALAVAHVEVRLSQRCAIMQHTVAQIVEAYILENFDRLEIGAELDGWSEIQSLKGHVESVDVGECSLEETYPLVKDLRLAVHVYQPSAQSQLDEFAAVADEDEDSENNVMAATVRELPSRGLIGVWESLIYEEDIKPRLLNYIYTTLLFSDADVDFNIVTWNRVVLLHGPPGTGKTSLCRALAQKLAIRLSDRYTHGKLVEINSHSLFSKWFSESGKLVQKLFAKVTEMVEDEGAFVVVLIDEVESLTAARAGAMSGTEPSDALRVVNALLTQLDKLKHRKNVLVMSTSNIAQAIDSAFVDRADIKQYIGLPPPQAVYWILQGCFKELMRARIVEGLPLLDWKQVEMVKKAGKLSPEQERIRAASLRLYQLAETCQGMSGRTLRRLPVLAHARYVGFSHGTSQHGGGGAPVEVWIDAMEKVVGDEGKQMDKLESLVGTGKI